jgi:hypothetical protein
MARTRITYAWADEEARELGQHHGYVSAQYADGVSGEDLDLLSPEPTRPLGMTPRAAMFYDDGFDRGIDEFKIDDDQLDWDDEDWAQYDAALADAAQA